MVVHPVSHMDTLNSKTKAINGADWYINVGKHIQNGEECLYAFLNVDWDKLGTKVYMVSFTVRIISRGSTEPSREVKVVEYRNDRVAYGVPCLMKWKDFIDEKNKHVVHDIAFMEAVVYATRLV